MTFHAWNPFRELDDLRRDLNRSLNGVGLDDWSFPFSRFSFLPGRAARAYPLINLNEDVDHFYIEALAPGVDAKSLAVSVVDRQLRIEGEKKAIEGIKPDAWHRAERAAGRFVRTIALPTDVDSTRIEANYRDGLLEIKLPKTEAAKPKLIDVKVV